MGLWVIPFGSAHHPRVHTTRWRHSGDPRGSAPRKKSAPGRATPRGKPILFGRQIVLEAIVCNGQFATYSVTKISSQDLREFLDPH